MIRTFKSLITVAVACILCMPIAIFDIEARGGGGRGGGGFRGGGMRAGGGGFRGGGMRAGGYRAGGISRGRFAGGGRPAGFARPMGRTGFNRPITERSFARAGGIRPGMRSGMRSGFRAGARPGMRARGFRSGYRPYGRHFARGGWNRGWWNRGWGRWPWWSGWGLGLGLGLFPWWWGGSPAWWSYRNPWYWYYWNPELQSYSSDISTFVMPDQTTPDTDDSNEWLVINSTEQDINAISGDTTIRVAPGSSRLITKSINNRIRITTDSASNLFEVEPDDSQLTVITTDNQLDIETD